MGISAGAEAQIYVALQNTSAPILFNGLQFSISGCTFNSQNTSSNCAAADDVLALTAGTHGVNASLEGYGAVPAGASVIFPSGPATVVAGVNGSDILLGPTGAGQSTSLSLTLNVSATSDGTRLSNYSTALTGTASPPLTGLTDSYKVQAGTYTNNIKPSLNGAATSVGFGPVSSLSVNIKLGLENPTTIRSVNRSSQFFGTAPEPATLAIVSTGIAGLAVLRRRYRARGRDSQAS